MFLQASFFCDEKGERVRVERHPRCLAKYTGDARPVFSYKLDDGERAPDKIWPGEQEVHHTRVRSYNRFFRQ